MAWINNTRTPDGIGTQAARSARICEAGLLVIKHALKIVTTAYYTVGYIQLTTAPAYSFYISFLPKLDICVNNSPLCSLDFVQKPPMFQYVLPFAIRVIGIVCSAIMSNNFGLWY